MAAAEVELREAGCRFVLCCLQYWERRQSLTDFHLGVSFGFAFERRQFLSLASTGEKLGMSEF